MRIKWKSHRKNIPQIVNINKSPYEIVWTKGFTNAKVVGETRWSPKQIAIKTEEPDKETVHTFFHEAIHAISHEYDVNLTETQVKQLELAYSDMYRLFKQLEGTEK